MIDPKMRWHYEYVVRGAGPFPHILLTPEGMHYAGDESRKCSLVDADFDTKMNGERREVALVRDCKYSTDLPNFDRWRSHGWRFISVSRHDRKTGKVVALPIPAGRLK